MVATAPERVNWALPRPLLAAAVAAGVFALALDGGAYALESRASLAVATWWALIMAIVLGLWPLVRPPRAALVAGGLLAAFCAFTALSLAWAPSAERVLVEANRAALLAGVFAVAVLAGTRGNLCRWLDGLAGGLAAVGVLALASRLFPDALPAGNVPDFLPAAVTRLSWPVEYWNGLAILVALGVPLLLRAALAAPLAWRGVAVAVIPALAAAMYLTSSRGGFATAAAGVLVFAALTARRWAAVGAIAVALTGSAAAVAVLLARPDLVNRPFDSPLAAGQGRSAALLVAAICAASGLVYALGARHLGGLRPPRALGYAAATLVAAALVAGVAAADPARRFEEFRALPPAYEGQDFVRAHLLSGSGSGRWQFWTAAVEQWRERPLAGHGAGSYESWWAEHGSFAHFLRDAHSLYLETLGELGVAGFVLLAAALGTGLVAWGRRLAASGGEERVALAACLAAFAAFLLAAGIDWMWELTVVSVVGMLLLGLLTGPATATAARRPKPAAGAGPPSRRPFAVALGALALGWLVVCAQAVPLLTQVKLSSSQTAVRDGDAAGALAHAHGARELQPWAASPYLQLALVHEARGDLPAAAAAIGAAIDRDSRDWRLWLVAARLETRSGDVPQARRSLARAVELNPRSPLFSAPAE